MTANADIVVWRKEKPQPYIVMKKNVTKGTEIVVEYGVGYNSYA